MATLVVDNNVIKVLPSVKEIVSVSKSGESAWARASRIDVLHEDNSEESYFMKVSRGHHGLEALKGEYESTSAIYAITPDFCPKPIAWGTFKTDKDSHFYICKFYEFTDGLPNPKMFGANLAKLHSSHTSPTGKFGFHVVTYNGDLPQDNAWSDSWEAFFESGFNHVLNIRKARAGPSAELDELLQPFFENVIPRLLRPLETSGNTIQPSLVHGDLWCGNAAITDEDTEEGIVFDPSSFWGHNEYELGNWRPERNKFTRKYFNAYHSHIPKSAPEDDYDDRNALYAMRFNLNAATLFPSQKVYLDMVIDEMRRLVQKFPDGYTGHSPRADILAHRHANAMAVSQNAEVQQHAGDVDGTSALPSGQGQPVSAETDCFYDASGALTFLSVTLLSLYLLPVVAVNTVPAAAFTALLALTATDALGLTVYLGGFAFEVVADRQKSRWMHEKRAKLHDEAFMSRGLWSKSQYPNYFGESTFWTGIATAAAGVLVTNPVQIGLGLGGGFGGRLLALSVSYVSPAFVTLLLTT